MTIQQLRMVRKLVECGSISKAAQQCFPSSVVVLGKFRRFHFPILSICSPEPRFFPYLLQIFNALSELFLLKKIFRYVIIIVLYSTLSESGYGLLFKKRKEEKRDIFTNV